MRNDQGVKENGTKQRTNGKENGDRTTKKREDTDRIEMGGGKATEKSPHFVFW